MKNVNDKEIVNKKEAETKSNKDKKTLKNTKQKSKQNTKENLKDKPKQVTKDKINFEKKYKDAKEQIKLLNQKNLMLELENQKNIEDFQAKAKTFGKKAQEEINKYKTELNTKTEEEIKHIKKYSSQDMLEIILEPINNIEIAIKTGKNNEAVKAYVIGFEMLLNQFYQELKNFGLTRIEPQVGQEFDPTLHHAISTIKSSSKTEVNKIIEIKKIGFKYHDRTIKPAVVTIGKK